MIYHFKRFFHKIKRSIKYIRLVWKTETYDYSYALEFWKESLLEIKQGMLNGYHASPEVHTKRIDEIVILLTRLQDYDKYTEKFYEAYDKKYGELTWDAKPEEFNGVRVSRMIFTNKNRETPEAKKEFNYIRNHGEYLYKQDIDRLALLFKKYLRSFWD